MIRRIVGIHFSPIGGTANITERLVQDLADRLDEMCPDKIVTESYDLLHPVTEEIELDEDTIAVIGMPVYVGKVPLPALRALDRVRANGAVALTAVSFGARSYGNALYELHHFAEAQGFKVVGAGAFSVLYNKRGRKLADAPYTGDISSVNDFGKAASAKIRRLAGSNIEGLRIRPAPLEVAGKLPVHLASRISPAAAVAAQDLLERICIRRKGSEWFL